MDSELNAVIDKVAEKIGVAVEAAGPIAETVVREMAIGGLFQCWQGVALLLFGLVVGCGFAFVAKENWTVAVKETSPLVGLIILSVIVSAGFCIAGIVNIGNGLYQYATPTLHAIEALR